MREREKRRVLGVGTGVARRRSWGGPLLAGIAILALAGSWTGGYGQPCGPWVDVTVDPPNPTSNDVITLNLSGRWCDSCVPGNPTVSIVGKTITVFTTNKSAMCFPVVTPWTLSIPVGRLSPGRYSVLVVHNGQPIGGLEILEVQEGRRPGPDFLIEAIRWTPVSPPVGEQFVEFEVMVINVGKEKANLAGVVLEIYKVKAGQAVAVGQTSWTSGSLNPGETLVAKVQTFPYSPLTWEGGTFAVRACMDVTNVVQEADETNNCTERPITIAGAALPLLVTAGSINLPPYSLLDVPVAYQVKDPLGGTVDAGTKKTPFTLAYPKGFQVVLDAPDTHDFHRLRHWKVSGTQSGVAPDPVTVAFNLATPRAEAQYTIAPERKCTECFRGTLGLTDTCGNGTGYSVPGPAGGDPHCKTPDCCGWYQVSHVHDLGQVVVNFHLIVEYTPGYRDGCQSTVSVDISLDAQNWTQVFSSAVTTVDLHPPRQLWGTYITCVRVPRGIAFRYVRVTIKGCYVDYSAVHLCGD